LFLASVSPESRELLELLANQAHQGDKAALAMDPFCLDLEDKAGQVGQVAVLEEPAVLVELVVLAKRVDLVE